VRRRLLAATALTLLLAAALPLRAHRGSTKLVVVERTPEGARIEVELEAVDVAVELGLPEDTPVEETMRRPDAIRRWLEAGWSARSDGGACPLRAGAPEAREVDGQDRIRVVLRARCPAPRTGVRLRDGTIFDSDPQHEAFVRTRWTGEGDARVLRVGRQEVELGAPPSVSALLGRFLWEGVLHLVTGYDHLLFLLSLVLTAGGLAAREGMRPALKDVAWIVTAFTLGHSVTLIAAALGVVVLPSRLVESVIAGSIVVVALLNIARPEARRTMPWLAFGFGLIHGFGFSGVLAELGLPAQARVLSLVSFNVGIELAQLAFVAVLLVPLERTARLRGYETWVVKGGSALIALLAGFWLVERALGLG
jgi:hypothetical protein